MSLREADLKRVLQVLMQHVSEINARVMCERASRVLHDDTCIAAHEWPLYIGKLAVTAKLFLPEAQIARMVDELHRTAGPGRIEHKVVKREIAIGSERELQVARMVARDMCYSLGASGVVMQRVAAQVSELARQLLAKAPGACLELDPLPGTPPRLRIVADGDSQEVTLI
jgi:hypothetical protein